MASLTRPILAALALLTSAAAPPPITPDDLREHIEVLASDDYGGRKPGTEGENKTILYIATKLQQAGLVPAGPKGSWYQPLEVVTRTPVASQATWTANGRQLRFDANLLTTIGAEERSAVQDAPVWFAGHGMRIADKGIDQLAGADLNGAVALILYDGPNIPGLPSFSERVEAVRAAGAAAVIGIVGDEVPWEAVQRSFAVGQNRLGTAKVAALQGAMPMAAVSDLIRRGGGNLESLLDSKPGPTFRAVQLPVRASISAETRIARTTTHNVIGRLPGTGKIDESLLYLGHWDHLGECRSEGADRLCNGAIDNASGIAILIEVAERLAANPRPVRDTLVLATTAEEMGLLGAAYFAEQPTVPLKSIVGAINVDTAAIVPAGAPVAVIGRGRTPLDPLIESTVLQQGRQVAENPMADSFIERQDGWALLRAGVPTVLITGVFSDKERFESFISERYHKPNDDLEGPLVLDGAAEDANLLVALGRRIADPAEYPTPQPQR
jgi:Zn-dependent M28 family amino/carboxypeptidase